MVLESEDAGRAYFNTRFPYDESKNIVWSVIGDFLTERYGVNGTVVDVGAGYGYFLNGIDVERKFAVDRSRYPLNRTEEDVDCLVGDAANLPLKTNYADVVMASNVLEHLTMEEIQRSLKEFRRVLRPDGTLFIVTPNFALAPRKYFDDFTHESILTHRSVADLLGLSGFNQRDRIVRFLPFSSEGSLPVVRSLVALYLRAPLVPFAGQSLFVSTPAD